MMKSVMTDEQIEQLVTQVLERREEPTVPADFAARVRAALPPVPVKRRRIALGNVMCVAGAVLSLAGMFVLAPHATFGVGNLAFDLECVLLLQAAGIGYYLVGRQGIRS